MTPAQGVVVALQAGLDASSGDLIAFTDDDAEPRSDWVARLLATVAADPRVGGAGGRDIQPGNTERPRDAVGQVQWFGRVVGAHHLGAGVAREVDVLKGVNLAMRAAPLRAIGFDGRLRGAGAQLHWELGVCLGLRRAGWKLIYDPSIIVDHHVAQRPGTDQLHRGTFGSAAMIDAVHNETLLILEHLSPIERVAFLVWEGLIGTVAAPGYLNAVRLRAQGHHWAFDAWRATRRGRKLAFSAFEAARTAAQRKKDE
jgi:GT2 family glycosyltransferase